MTTRWGHAHTLSPRDPILVRSKTRKALPLENKWYHRPTLLVNPDIQPVEPVKVDQVERAVLEPAATMHDFTSGKRLFELEPT